VVSAPGCPSDEELTALVEERLEPAQLTRVREHSSCAQEAAQNSNFCIVDAIARSSLASDILRA
jgi:hypothetical protein